MNPQLRWLNDMISLLNTDQIVVPETYYERVTSVKSLLENDVSGLVNTLLDFSINCATVDYTIDTDNQSLTDLLNSWLENINAPLRGEVPVGITALSKEYFRERWKGSSFLLLRTTWEEKDGWYLPTKMWFVDGESITDTNPNEKNKIEEVKTVGNNKYYLKVSKEKYLSLPNNKNEKIFVQRPYTPWGNFYTVPYLIQKGIYKNLKFLEMLETKGEYVVGKALEYLFLVKKGTEGMALSNNPDFVYSQDDLKNVKEDLGKFINERNSSSGVSTYTTNFDTQIEHLIPEYSKALKAELYAPIERRILGGLGMVDVIQGIASSRRESVLNPKPFIAETKAGIDDFKTLINDIVVTIIEKNKEAHRKQTNKTLRINNTPIKEFVTEEAKTMLRSLYDRGCLSKRTFVEVAGDCDYDIEVSRRKQEKENKQDEIMFAPVIQNNGLPTSNQIDKKEDNNKTSVEKLNFKQASEVILEEAPYKKVADLPDQVKVLPKAAQKIWMEVFNDSYPKGEDYARKVAWTAVKNVYKKKDEKWIQKSNEEIEMELASLGIEELTKMKNLEILGKKEKLLDKLLKERADENL